MNSKFFLSIINILTLCIIIGGVSLFLIKDGYWVGVALILLGSLCLLSLIPFKITLKSMVPDIFFGFIDNSILAGMAIFGGYFAGITGAILGGVVGNAITDGIAGIFEGYYAEKLRSKFIAEERTMLRSAVGKMAGCLFGAGVVFIIAYLFKF